jgi:hypothetical protein
MRLKELFSIVILIIMMGVVSAPAQMNVQFSEDTARMMQEPSKALAQASIQYMAVFTRALNIQAKERSSQIDTAFINNALSEMKRAYGMIDKYQTAHVGTMSEAMQSKVAPMMERMNRNLATVKKQLDILEQEVNGSRDLSRISLLTGQILRALEDMPGKPGRMMGQPGG